MDGAGAGGEEEEAAVGGVGEFVDLVVTGERCGLRVGWIAGEGGGGSTCAYGVQDAVLPSVDDGYCIGFVADCDVVPRGMVGDVDVSSRGSDGGIGGFGPHIPHAYRLVRAGTR